MIPRSKVCHTKIDEIFAGYVVQSYISGDRTGSIGLSYRSTNQISHFMGIKKSPLIQARLMQLHGWGNLKTLTGEPEAGEAGDGGM